MSDDRTVTLYGGPLDGKKLNVTHGDAIHLPIMRPAPSLPPDMMEKTVAISDEYMTYRRSLNTKTIFVYQP